MASAAAAAVIFDADGRVLLIREGYGRERYGLPGGVMEEGESPRTAAIREVKEELGLDIEPVELIGVYHLRTPRSEGLRFFFRCEVLEGEPMIPDSGELASFLWTSPGAMPSPMTDTAPFAIRDAAAGRSGVYREIDTRDQTHADTSS